MNAGHLAYLNEELPKVLPLRGKLSYVELMTLRDYSVITKLDGGLIDEAQVQPASIDVTLGTKFFTEYEPEFTSTIDLMKKETPKLVEKTLLPDQHIELAPGEFILASTSELFCLPNFIVSTYNLNSSLGRSGLNHALAGFADPGWHGSALTLELHNINRHHSLILRPGMKIGQMNFDVVTPVPDGKGYDERGQYNKQTTTNPSGGLRTGE